jgi:hypothetical protein
LEYWSVGVLESRREGKHPLGMETEVIVVFSTCTLRDLVHHSNTPVLQHTLDYFETKPYVPGPVEKAEFSLLE